MEVVLDRVKYLEEEIKKHKSLYYSGRAEISDQDFDGLEAELEKLNPESPVLDLVGTIIKGSKKIKHDTKMLSLGKTYKKDDLIKWIDEKEVVSTFKIDGVSCSLVYENMSLKIAKTRGDGSFGEDIFPKVCWIQCVPQKLKIKASKEVEVRGEIFCDEQSFFHLAKEMVSRGLEKPTSQRNIVAGLMGRKENLDLCKFLKFKAFGIIDLKEKSKTEWERILVLEKMGFELPEFTLHKNPKKIDGVIEESREFMSEGDYLIDGLVFSYNDLNLHEELGSTAHHPRYKLAFKCAGESKKTKIKKILWSVSRNGVLTPVAEIVPTELSGAMISRVTLHNYGLVESHQLKEGDEIEIIRSGEVIPKFLEVVKSSGNEFIIPTHCPSCLGELLIDDIRLRCENQSCPDKVKEEILNFIQKIGIDDLSSKRLEEMIRVELVASSSDLYDLTVEKLLTLDKTKEKLATKLHASIEGSKKSDLKRFLSALGITGGAYNKCEKVVDGGFDTIEKVMSLKIEDLMQLDSFAEKSSFEFVESIKKKKKLINELLKKGFKFEKPQVVEGELSGMSICITGALSEKRTVVEGWIRSVGGKVVGSVSKNTHVLLTNETDSKSSKFKKAKELNIKIITENDLKDML